MSAGDRVALMMYRTHHFIVLNALQHIFAVGAENPDSESWGEAGASKPKSGMLIMNA